jgi:serine/threonine protein kinase
VLRALDHPDIPRFLASFQEGTGVGTRLYLAQEFLEGESLLQRIERERFDEDEAWQLAEQVLETLTSLHQRTPALVHRDIKPANLILRPSGRVALVDFGAARQLTRGVTHGSTLVGTFGYMPPEQLGGTVDAGSDLYALGATLVHALSGRMPADLIDEQLALAFEKHVQVTQGLHAFLGKLLAPRRSERFSSATDALMALRLLRAVRPGADGSSTASLVDAIPTIQTAPPATQENSPRPISSRKLVMALVAGALLATGLLTAFVVRLLIAPMPEVIETPLPSPPPMQVLPPSRPVPPQGGPGTHRNFRTPWQGGSSTP